MLPKTPDVGRSLGFIRDGIFYCMHAHFSFREATEIPGVLRNHGIRLDTRELDLRVPREYDRVSLLASSVGGVPSSLYPFISFGRCNSFL